MKICFSIGKYHDSVLCDVVPMEASHVLLGRPWQFDKRANHDGYSNKYSFEHNERKVTLVPLSPKEVCEDQNKLREKREQENKKLREKEKKSEKKDRKESLLVKVREVKRTLLTRQPLYMLYCKELNLNSNVSNKLPSGVDSVLQEFEDVFPKEIPPGLPPLRGIEHHIDLILGVVLPNRPAYRSNPQETKEIQK